ncbi:MAG: ERCC4 domain-containing protein [bacterium]
MHDRLLISADYREKNSDVYRILKNNKEIHLRVRKLKAGDYCVENKVLCERKTLNDLKQSIIDGRLFKQAINLCQTNLNCVLILEGTGHEFKMGKMSREAIQGALITIILVFGIPVLRSRNAAETVTLFHIIASQLINNNIKRIKRIRYKPLGIDKNKLCLLESLPGIGPETAKNLLDYFGSVRKIVTAKKEDLMIVPGIGKKRAQAIFKVVT